MWALIVTLVGTLLAIFIATAPPFKHQALPTRAQLVLAVFQVIAYVASYRLLGYLLPTLFLGPAALVALPSSAMFWFGFYAVLEARKKPPGQKLDSLKRDLASFFISAPTALIAIILIQPTLIPQSLASLNSTGRSVLGASLALVLAVGLFVLRLNYLRFYASLEIAVGIGTSFLVVRRLPPNSPVSLEQVTALAAALYVIVRGLDNYRRSREQNLRSS